MLNSNTMGKVSIADVLELSVAERIQLAEDIWDSLVEIPHPVVLTEEQRDELDRRLDDYHQYPHDGITWDSLKSLILGRE
jgi:putative addiction module component (TIGR02574 family)